MTTATLKSYSLDQNTALVSVDGSASDVALRLCGSDKSVVAHLVPGQKIRFDVSVNRRGERFAIDVTPIPGVPRPRIDRCQTASLDAQVPTEWRRTANDRRVGTRLQRQR
jgi:cold shock CspA family protein